MERSLETFLRWKKQFLDSDFTCLSRCMDWSNFTPRFLMSVWMWILRGQMFLYLGCNTVRCDD